MLEKKLFLDPAILYQTKRFGFQDQTLFKDSVRESKACA